MKKTLLVLLLVVALLMPLAAGPKLNIKQASKGNLCVGVNLGTTLGVAFKWDNKNWDLYANLGWFVNSSSFQLDLGAELPVSEFKIGKETFHLNAGLMLPLYVGIYDKTVYFGIDCLGTGAISYEFKDFPLEVYTRIGLGVAIKITPELRLDLGYSGALGAVYKLN